MPIHYETEGDHLLVITIDRPERKNAMDLHHFRDLAKAWRDFRDDDDLWVAIVTGTDGCFMSGADLQATTSRRSPRCPSRSAPARSTRSTAAALRRHRGGAAQRQALQADHRRHRRTVRRRRHGDARRHRHPRRHPAGDLRGDGAQAGPVRRRRHHGAPAPPGAVRRRRWSSCSPPRRSPRRGRSSSGLLNEIVEPDELHGPRPRLGRGASSPTARSPSGRPRSRWCGACRARSARPTRSRARSPASCSQSDDAKEGPKAFAEKRDPGWTNREVARA